MQPQQEPYRLRLRPNCSGADPLLDRLPADLDFGHDVPISIDFSEVEFIRPSGLAFVFALAFTVLRTGRSVRLREPAAPDKRDYLRRTNFWSVLEARGFAVPSEWRGFNLGHAPGLVEPSIVTGRHVVPLDGTLVVATVSTQR